MVTRDDWSLEKPRRFILRLSKSENDLRALLARDPNLLSSWLKLGQVLRELGDRRQALHAFQKAHDLNPDHIKVKIECAIELIALNCLGRAHILLSEILSQKKNHVVALVELGKLYSLEQQIGEACNVFRTALGVAPGHLSATLNLSIALTALCHYEEAETLLESALVDSDENILLRLQLGELNVAQKKVDVALDIFQTVVNRFPQRIDGHLKIAKLWCAQRKFKEADNYLQTLLQNKPRNRLILLELGHLKSCQNRYKDAQKYYRKAQRYSYPYQCEAQLAIGKSFEQMGDLKQALDCFELILNEWPENIQANAAKANIFQQQGNVTTACQIYECLLDSNPQYLPAYLDLAQCLGDMDNSQKGIALLETHAHLFLDDMQIKWLQVMGSLYRKDGHLEEAFGFYKRAFDAGPQTIGTALNLASILCSLGKLLEAREYLKQAIDRHPRHLKLLMRMGDLERRLGRHEQALTYFQRASEAHPRELDAHCKGLEMLRFCGRFEEAIAKLHTLQTLYPNDARLLMEWGLLEKQQGQWENALRHLRAAQTATSSASTASHGWDIQWTLIDLLNDLGRWDEAMVLLRQSSSEFIHQPRTQMMLAGIYHAQLRFSDATTVYQALMKTLPSHIGARRELAKLLSQSGRTPDAIALLEETYAQIGPDPFLLRQLGQLYQAQENWERAHDSLAEAYERYPHQPTVHCAFAELLFKQGDIDQAFQILRQALQDFSHCVAIPIKLTQLLIQAGHIAETLLVLNTVYRRFSHHVPFILHFCRVHIRCGDLALAESTLSQLSTNPHRNWTKQRHQLLGAIAIQKLDLTAAAQHYQNAIALAPAMLHEYTQLAQIFVLQGDSDAAYEQISLATETLEQRTPPGLFILPIKSHVATIINELRMNPPMMARVKEAQEENGLDRILALASSIAEEPSFLGTSLHLAKELRCQGIFDRLKDAFPDMNSDLSSIPRHIVQFWDSPQPPNAVIQLGKTWTDHNPNYTYKRFSLEEAIAFLQEYYEDQILQAFYLCTHPAIQADFFRLAYLNRKGGFYADADDRCLSSIEPLRASNAELVLYQEDFACFGNNFLGCVPDQPIIRSAFYQAVDNLLNYSAEWAWSQTGPGLLTGAVCSGLLPYLASPNLRMWPRLLVLTRRELTSFVWSHVYMTYKNTEKSWKYVAYPTTKVDTLLDDR